MLRDIDFKRVTDLALAVTPESDSDEGSWKVYLINLKNEPITDVLVNSKGYGEVGEEEVKTSQLRQFIERIEPNGYVALELLTDELTKISNQFWVSFYINGELFDKKYVFVRESINEDFFTEIPVLDTRGVMIK